MLNYLKAIVAGVIAGLSSLEASLANGHIDLRNGIASIIAALVAFSAVAFIPNPTAKKDP